MKKKLLDLCLLLAFAAAVGFPGIRADNIEKALLNGASGAPQQSAPAQHPQAVIFAPVPGSPGQFARSPVLAAGGNAGGTAAPHAAGTPALTPTPATGTDAPPPSHALTEGGTSAALTAANRVSGLAFASAAAAEPGWDILPEWAEAHAPWSAYGAHRDFFGIRLAALADPPDVPRPSLIDAGFPPFRVGGRFHGRAFISPCGTVSFSSPRGLWPDGLSAPGAAAVLAPLGGPMSLAPPGGAFWHGVSPSNTLVLTWRGACLNRDPALPASLQCELLAPGDFVFRVRLPAGAPDALFTGAGAPFRTAALNAGGGEAFAWDAGTLALARSAGGIEIAGRGFAPSDPALPPDADTDGDGLTDAEEILVHGTDPLRADTDGDGLPDGMETDAGTGPLNPDTDGDSVPDGFDAAPLDPAIPAPPAGMTLAERILNGVPFTQDENLDSDGDDWPDWQEIAAGTDPGDWRSHPRTDASTPPPFFTLTVTLLEDLPAPAVLTVRDRPLALSRAGSWTATLPEGQAFDTAFLSPVPCAPRLSLAVSGSGAAAFVPAPDFIRAPAPGPALLAAPGTGVPGFAVPGGQPVPLGMAAQPTVSLFPPALCFHNGSRQSVQAVVSPPMPGTYGWAGGVSGTPDSPVATVTRGSQGVGVVFTARDALRPTAAEFCPVTVCAAPPPWEMPPDGSTNAWCEADNCAHTLCVCDNPGASDTDTCAKHGQSVAACLGRACPRHKCAPALCPKDWCHDHDRKKIRCADKHKGEDEGNGGDDPPGDEPTTGGDDGGTTTPPGGSDGNGGGGGTPGGGTPGGGSGENGGDSGHVCDAACDHPGGPGTLGGGDDNGGSPPGGGNGNSGGGNSGGGTPGGGGSTGGGNNGGGGDGGGVYPPKEKEFPPGGGGNSTSTVSVVIGYGQRGLLAVNTDDDDLDGTADCLQSGRAAGENDVAVIIPAPGCCPCASHGGDIHYVYLDELSPGLSLHTDEGLTSPLQQGSQIYKGTPVYLQATAASPDAWESHRIIWSANDGTRLVTNELTSLRLDIRPDFDLDGDIDTDDLTAERTAASQGAWTLPAQTGAVHLVRLTAALGWDVPGTLTLSLRGDGIRIWGAAAPDLDGTLLLEAPGTGAEPATVTVERDLLPLDLYVEAHTNGTAVLSFAFTGSGDAAGVRYTDALTLTTLRVEFTESAGTLYNFSPSLGEEAGLGVKVIPASLSGGYPGLSFRLDIIRETAGGGVQHIDRVDLAPGPTVAAWMPLTFSERVFAWNGIPGVFGSSAPQAAGRDEFQGVSTSVVRVFPAVTAGQPVPPPFYTAVARVIRDSDQSVVCEARKRVFVPQVVRMTYDAAAVTVMLAGLRKEGGNHDLMIEPVPTNQWPGIRRQIASLAEGYYSTENVNVRFVDSFESAAQPHSVMLLTGDGYSVNESGHALGTAPLDVMNVDPSQVGILYYSGLKESLIVICGGFEEAQQPLPPPVTPDELVRLWGWVAAHETGHTLGLVARELLGGSTGFDPGHNQSLYTKNLMDSGSQSTIHEKMGRGGVVWTIYPLNAEYLRFILPKQEVSP